jgi:biotin carboxyl carrier protein
MNQYRATVGSRTFELLADKRKKTIVIDNKEIPMDMIGDSGSYHLLVDGRGYDIRHLGRDAETGHILLDINGRQYSVKLETAEDILLKKMGMDVSASAKPKELKAPMPGLVLDIIVSEGDQVKKGDPLLILEAMKMENVIKAPADAVIARIPAQKGKPVEKNQLLINFG